ncbi:EI24 domain-containing protein [Pseudooctadecabacter jejudonensis]|uniref:CysZ-like protein n=1 Tax=Pseudooctadecabacter jejudonensis TaxID=1391910 RepID=A0A1Y5SLW3_9RHOB|nr:EI24 domain-containing protein [Pseudooctadecabacter jejudonensis]SLN43434.1 CysZ-like protein [Pseudooctadecabacter jejudonensis]
MILSDVTKALAQMGDPRFRRVLALGVGLTLALLVAVYAAFLGFLGWLDPASLDLPFLGPNAFVGGLLSWGSMALMLVFSIFLMIPVASAITSLFLEDVAAAVEAQHYPHLPAATPVSWADGIRDTLSFMALLIFVNLVGLLLLPLFWFAAPVMFYLINGFLLGREYFTVAAMRRAGRQGAKDLRRRNLPQIWMAGTLIAVPLTIPVLNLLVPILGAATFTHLYHRVAATR